jgi:hypothetical protein
MTVPGIYRRTSMNENRADIGADTRWLSYGELADIRGIGRESAIRIARRHRWARRSGNDGTVRVAVPRSFLEAKSRDRPDDPRDNTGDSPPDISRLIKALEGQTEALKGQMGVVEAHNVTLRDQAAVAEQRAARADERVDQVLADLRAERAALQSLQAESAAAGRRLQEQITALERQLEAAMTIDTGALQQSAWAGEDSSDQSAGADPAHQVERLWSAHRRAEARLEQARGLDTGNDGQPVAEPTASGDERQAETPTEADPSIERQRRRWWRRLLRRSSSA